jgi:hypothetical protein
MRIAVALLVAPTLFACSPAPLGTPPGPFVGSASIHVSRSTNSPEIDVAVNADGSAERTAVGGGSIRPAPMSYPPESPAVEQFLADLVASGDVSQIPTAQCPKSASFGTTMTVTANGKTSGDLQCLQNPTAAQAALAKDCATLTGT